MIEYKIYVAKGGKGERMPKGRVYDNRDLLGRFVAARDDTYLSFSLRAPIQVAGLILWFLLRC